MVNKYFGLEKVLLVSVGFVKEMSAVRLSPGVMGQFMAIKTYGSLSSILACAESFPSPLPSFFHPLPCL